MALFSLTGQELENSRMAQLRQSAHDRFIQGRENFVGSNPAAVSMQERAQFLGPNAKQRALWDHEMQMLKQTGANDLGVAQERSRGMIGQGSDAAKATAQGAVDVAKTHLTQAEAEIAGKKAVAKMQAKSALDVANAQGKSALDVARETGVQSVARQAEANKGEVAKAEAARAAAERGYTNDIIKAQIAAGGKADQATANAQARIISAQIAAGATLGKNPATVMAELKELYKNDPSMLQAIGSIGGATKPGAEAAQPASGVGKPVPGQEGQEQKLADGRTAVYRGGNWVIKE